MSDNEDTPNQDVTWQRAKRRRSSSGNFDPKQTAPEIQLSNRYSSLSNHEVEVNNSPNKENSNSNQVTRVQRPPPIYIYDVLNFSEMANTISSVIDKNDYICKALVNSTVKIYTTTSDSFRKLAKYLKEKNIIHHTYQLKEDRSFRVVIRNLHHTTDINEVKFELAEKGFDVRNIINIKHRITKSPLPLFFLDLEPNENNKFIYSISYLQNTKIVIEPPRKNKEIPQCSRCLLFNHTKSYCLKPYRCVRCGLFHRSESCTKPKDTPATCANCSLNHPANYKGCSTYKELIKRRNMPLQNKIINNRVNKNNQIATQFAVADIQTPPQTPSTHLNQNFQQTQRSYASVLINDNHNNNSNDLNTMLTSFINEFKSLFTQLLNQNSMILNLLTKVINKNDA